MHITSGSFSGKGACALAFIFFSLSPGQNVDIVMITFFTQEDEGSSYRSPVPPLLPSQKRSPPEGEAR